MRVWGRPRERGGTWRMQPGSGAVRCARRRNRARQGARARALVCVQRREETRMQAGQCAARGRATGAPVISNPTRQHLARRSCFEMKEIGRTTVFFILFL